jgi:protein gp37
MYKRFHWNEEVRLDLAVLDKIAKIKEPSRIFICSTHDLFGEWIPDKWIFDIITICQKYPQHTFLLLTKNPKRYLDFTFRDNFWLGATLTKQSDDWRSAFARAVKHRGVKFFSIEPLLGDIKIPELPYINWLIIGGLTPTPKHPHIWIDNILKQSDEHNIPVFIKHNAYYPTIRQEFPERTNEKN